MKDILIIAHFTHVPGEKGNSRFHYIANLINKDENSVELITTSFSHRIKEQRKVCDNDMKSLNYKLTMIYEPGYKDNVSLRRFYSHYKLSRKIKKYLDMRKKPDVIYCAVPSLSVANVAAKYAKKNKVRFIIDVQDLWPEAFKMVFKIPILNNILFYPMKKKADKIYSSADEIVAVSRTYADRALKVNNKCKDAHVVFLGTQLSEFDKYAKINDEYKKEPYEIWLAYVGTLGYSYDLISTINALQLLKKEGYNNIKFIVMGDGPLKNKFEEQARVNNVNCLFTGRLEYPKMVSLLCMCDIAVNPIIKGAAQSIINKVGDYAAAGLPVLNTQENKEYRDLVEYNHLGYNCINDDVKDIAEKLKLLLNKKEMEDFGKNNRKLAEEYFDRQISYKDIINLITK